jgi:adenylate cyclase
MAATRKLAAILAVDVVGYSKVAGADECTIAHALKRFDRPHHRRAGRVVKWTRDGALIGFRSMVDCRSLWHRGESLTTDL